MYDLPKTHKGTPLRPILSMTGLSHHEFGKWLAGLLQPLMERFSSHCVSDPFTFAKTMQNLDIDIMICTKRRLNGEIERIKKILLNNGYLKIVINTQMAKKITQYSTR